MNFCLSTDAVTETIDANVLSGFTLLPNTSKVTLLPDTRNEMKSMNNANYLLLNTSFIRLFLYFIGNSYIFSIILLPKFFRSQTGPGTRKQAMTSCIYAGMLVVHFHPHRFINEWHATQFRQPNNYHNFSMHKRFFTIYIILFQILNETKTIQFRQTIDEKNNGILLFESDVISSNNSSPLRARLIFSLIKSMSITKIIYTQFLFLIIIQ